MNYSGHIYPDNTVGYFRVASANGRQPVQPVATGEFLIGSGGQCDLRFGDPGIPEVHTVLQVEEDVVILSCKAESPRLLLNGQPETECKLSDGDMIELGQHRMLFRLAASAERITLDEDGFTEVESGTAVETIVDHIDEQIQLIDELSQTPDQAVMELLQAAQRAEAEAAVIQAPTSSAELHEVKDLIQKHHEASRIRLESLTEVLDNVVKQQKLIADTLEVLSERVQNVDSSSFPQRRASA